MYTTHTCLSAYACLSFLSCVVFFILKWTSELSWNKGYQSLYKQAQRSMHNITQHSASLALFWSSARNVHSCSQLFSRKIFEVKKKTTQNQLRTRTVYYIHQWSISTQEKENYSLRVIAKFMKMNNIKVPFMPDQNMPIYISTVTCVFILLLTFTKTNLFKYTILFCTL